MKRIIIGRNEKNSMFLIKVTKESCIKRFFKAFMSKPVYEYETDNSLVYIKSEKYIVNKIKKNMKFYVANGKSFTKVEVFGKHIRSKANNTKTDNISNLPVRIV